MSYYGDAGGSRPWKKANSIQLQPLKVKFNNRGAVEELVNWTIFRDELLSGISKQAIANLISTEKFDEERMRLNNEKSFADWSWKTSTIFLICATIPLGKMVNTFE